MPRWQGMADWTLAASVAALWPSDAGPSWQLPPDASGPELDAAPDIWAEDSFGMDARWATGPRLEEGADGLVQRVASGATAAAEVGVGEAVGGGFGQGEGVGIGDAVGREVRLKSSMILAWLS